MSLVRLAAPFAVVRRGWTAAVTTGVDGSSRNGAFVMVPFALVGDGPVFVRGYIDKSGLDCRVNMLEVPLQT